MNKYKLIGFFNLLFGTLLTIGLISFLYYFQTQLMPIYRSFEVEIDFTPLLLVLTFLSLVALSNIVVSVKLLSSKERYAKYGLILIGIFITLMVCGVYFASMQIYMNNEQIYQEINSF